MIENPWNLILLMLVGIYGAITFFLLYLENLHYRRTGSAKRLHVASGQLSKQIPSVQHLIAEREVSLTVSEWTAEQEAEFKQAHKKAQSICGLCGARNAAWYQD